MFVGGASAEGGGVVCCCWWLVCFGQVVFCLWWRRHGNDVVCGTMGDPNVRPTLGPTLFLRREFFTEAFASFLQRTTQ